jgi:hypothetical protein
MAAYHMGGCQPYTIATRWLHITWEDAKLESSLQDGCTSYGRMPNLHYRYKMAVYRIGGCQTYTIATRWLHIIWEDAKLNVRLIRAAYHRGGCHTHTLLSIGLHIICEGTSATLWGAFFMGSCHSYVVA